MTEKRRYSRSPSQLKSVTRCGEAFRVSRLQYPKPPRRPAPWSGLGIAVHSAFQTWELGDRQGDVVEIFENHYDAWVIEEKAKQPDLNLWILPPGTKYPEAAIKNYRKRGVEKDVPQYRQRCLEAEWEVLRLPSGEKALELEFEVDLDGVTVKGFVDRIQWWPRLGMAALEDLKTGSPDEDDDIRQLDIYALGVAEKYGVDLTHSRFWYTKLDRPGGWHRMEKSREYLAQQYKRLDSIIDGGLLLPNPGKICGICEVRPWCSEKGWLKPGESLSKP